MKVLLINPPQIFLRSAGSPVLFHPTGLAYVAAALEKEHEVRILDACAESRRGVEIVEGKYCLGLGFDEIAERIETIKPDAVGISVVFSANEYAGLKTASTVKSVDKNIVTILGGPHPTVRPVETLLHPDVDYVVINEGEYTTPELIRKIEEGASHELQAVCGIGFKVENNPVLTEPRELIEDLDSLAFPARHLLPMELYHDAEKLGVKSRELYNVAVDKRNARSTTIFSSRGCPFTCNFCSIHLTMGRRFRKRSAENVVKEIEEVVSKYGITHIDFEDDNFTFDKTRVRRICDLIIDKGLHITWSTPNGIRADIIDEDLVVRMKNSGCRRVFVAPESGVQDVVKNIINKNMSLEKVTEAVRLFAKHGIIIDASFVVGAVGKNGESETKRDIFGTIVYAMKLKRLGMNKAGFNIATPLIGTKMREYAEEANYVKVANDATESNKGKPIIETPEFTHRDLVVICGLGNWLVNYSFKEKLSTFWKHLKHPVPYLKYGFMLCANLLKERRLAKTLKGAS